MNVNIIKSSAEGGLIPLYAFKTNQEFIGYWRRDSGLIGTYCMYVFRMYSRIQHVNFLYIFWRARVCWPLLCLSRPFCILGVVCSQILSPWLGDIVDYGTIKGLKHENFGSEFLTLSKPMSAVSNLGTGRKNSFCNIRRWLWCIFGENRMERILNILLRILSAWWSCISYFRYMLSMLLILSACLECA